ncbi:MAG TPA: GerMN domain-containing protein, partial [Actinomycetota bacterium]|nr:GerMN domain-containing protein [Actinomycetota bacterium]
KVVSVSPVTSAPPAVDPDPVQDLKPSAGQSDAEVAVGFMNAMNTGDATRIQRWVMPEAKAQVDRWSEPAATVRVYSVFEPGPEYLSPAKRIVPIKVKLVGQLRQGYEWHPATGEELISLELQRSGGEARVANPGPVIWMRDVSFSKLYASTEVYMVPDQEDDPSPQLAPVPMFVPNGSPKLRVTRALQVLFAGPRSRYANLETAIPPGTRLLDLRYANDLVTLNLSRAFSQPTGSGQLRIGQLVWTVNRLIPTASVRILVEGHVVGAVGAYRFPAGRRWKRQDPPLDGMWPQRSQEREGDSILFVRQGEIYTIVPQPGQSPRPVDLDALSPKSAPTWSPDHRWMAFVSGSGNTQSLWLVQPGGKAFQPSDKDLPEGRLSAPSWSPDSQSVYLVVRGQSNDARLVEVTRSTLEVRRLDLPPLPGGLQPASVAVSPDGAFALAVAVRPDRKVEPAEQVPGGHLYLGQLGPEGVEDWSRQIAPGLGRIFSPVWVDAVTVGFIAETESKDDLGKLWTIKSDGWNPTAVLNDSDMPIGDLGNNLTADPAGRFFVVTARSSTGASLWMVNRQDKSVSYLTLPVPNAFDTDPSFASR